MCFRSAKKAANSATLQKHIIFLCENLRMVLCINRKIKILFNVKQNRTRQQFSTHTRSIEIRRRSLPMKLIKSVANTFFAPLFLTSSSRVVRECMLRRARLHPFGNPQRATLAAVLQRCVYVARRIRRARTKESKTFMIKMSAASFRKLQQFD